MNLKKLLFVVSLHLWIVFLSFILHPNSSIPPHLFTPQ